MLLSHMLKISGKRPAVWFCIFSYAPKQGTSLVLGMLFICPPLIKAPFLLYIFFCKYRTFGCPSLRAAALETHGKVLLLSKGHAAVAAVVFSNLAQRGLGLA